MKKLALVITVILASFSFTQAQHLKIKTYVEQTKVSPKLGMAIGRVSEYGIEYGAFYQESTFLESLLMSDEHIASLPHCYEKVFYGAYFNYPIVNHKYLNVDFNVRTGVVNNMNFIITPSFLTSFKPNKKMSFGIGIGVRACRPTLQSQVSITL